MAQRILDAAFWDDEDIASLALGERLLFICMVTDVSLSDDFGYLPASPKTLKKHAFGYDEDVSVEQVRQWRDNILRKCKNVLLFTYDGQEYIWLKNFDKWQNLRHRRRSNLPQHTAPGAIVSQISADFGNFPKNAAIVPQISADFGNFPKSSEKVRTDRIGEDRIESDSVGEDGVGREACNQEPGAHDEGGETAPSSSPAAPTAPAINSPSNEERVSALFELVRKGGILPSETQSEQYLDILDETPDFHLIELAFAEAARTNKLPTPGFIDKVLERCKREKCLPGQWPCHDPPKTGSVDANGRRVVVIESTGAQL